MVEVSLPPGPPAAPPVSLLPHVPTESSDATDPPAPVWPPPRRWPARVRAGAEVVACSSVPTQLLVQYAAVWLGVQPWRAPGVPTLRFLAVTQLADSVLLIALMALLTRARGDRLGPLWLGQRPWRREAALGLALVPAVFAVVAAILSLGTHLWPGLHNVQENPFESLLDTPARAAVMGLVVIVAGGLREELQRAFLLDRFERQLGGATAGTLLLSAAFGAGHYIQGWDAVVATGVAGAFWAVVYLRRRSVVAPVVSHALFDGLQVLQAVLGGPSVSSRG